MKHNHWKDLICVFVMGLCMFLSLPVSAAAAELPEGMLIGDEHGITVKKDGAYLLEVNDVMPGKTWHSTVSVINMEEDSTYQLSMLISPPEVSGILDLSEAIQMTLTYENELVYTGPVSGIGNSLNLQKEPLNLGIFKAGDSRALEVDLSISGEYTNKDFAVKNIMENIWTFKAVKTTVSEPEEPKEDANEKPQAAIPDILKPLGQLPQTGEEWRQALLYTCLGLFLLMLILLLWKSTKKNTQINSK